MNWATIWHLFRTDTRRLRWLIAVVWALLICEAVQFGSAGPWQQPSWGGSGGSDVPDVYSKYYQLWIPGFGLAAAILATSVGWLGVAAIRLRPARRLEMAASKLLLLAIWLFLPQIVAIIVVLKINGITLAIAIAAATGAAAAFVPLWLAMAAYGRLAGSPWRLLGAVGISIAVVAWLAVLIPREHQDALKCLDYCISNAWGERMEPLVCWWSGLSAILLLVLVSWTLHRWKPAWRCAAGSLGLLALAWGVITNLKPQAADFVNSLRALTQSELEKITLTPPTAVTTHSYGSGSREITFINATVTTRGLPDGVFCYWRRETELLVNRQINRTSVVMPASQRPVYKAYAFPLPDWGSRQIDTAVLSALPVEARTNLQQNNRADAAFSSVSLGSYTGKSAEYLDRDRMALDGNLTGVLYRYQTLADVSLNASPAQSPCHGGWLRWRVLPNANPKSLLVDLSAQYPIWGLGSNVMMQQSNSSGGYWRIFLYFPERGEMVPMANYGLKRSGRLLSGGMTERAVCKFDFVRPVASFSNSDLAQARLLILEPEILGVVQRDLRASALPVEMERRTPDSSDFYATLGPDTLPKYFFDEARKRRPDPETATAEEFGRWLQFCLAPHTMRDWQEAELALWVPRHLDVMLRTPYEFTSLTNALSKALPETQKSKVIAQVENSPWLIGVLRDRGWLPLAKDALLRLLKGPRQLSLEQQYAIASLQAPEAQDKLLETLERYGDITLYNILRMQPGIEPRLTKVVERYFARVTVHGKTPGSKAEYEYGRLIAALNMPLAHGIPAAKDDALVLFNWLVGVGGRLTEELARSFQLPAKIRADTKEATQYFQKLRPQDCHWDAITREWSANPQSPPQ